MAKGADTQEKKIVFDIDSDDTQIAEDAIKDPEILEALIESLGDSSRRIRQFSASTIRQISELKPEVLVGKEEELVDALYRPEAQTRWEILETLVRLTKVDQENAGLAFDAVQDALYDLDSGTVRLNAFIYFVHLGTLSEEWSDKVWPLLDETIQCYHGDNEFPEMLTALCHFTQGKISDKTREALIERLTFDAEQGKGYIKRQARVIIEELQKGAEGADADADADADAKAKADDKDAAAKDADKKDAK